MEIVVNVLKDWTELLKHELTTRGFVLDPSDDDNTVGIKYFNYCKRMVEQKVRIIKKSSVFSCPSDLVSGLNLIESKLTSGQDLTPHLSTRITDLNYNDELLNDWGIYHLHLGTSVDSRGFATRTGPLLFATFDDTNAYFINVMPHGSWTKQEMLRIVHKDWPESIEAFRIKDIVGLLHVPTDEEIKLFRRGNVNTMIEVEPGVVYAQPGGGYATSGDSTRAVRANNWYRKRMNQIEESFKQELNRILAESSHQELKTEPRLEFHLKIDGRKLFLVEQNNRIAVACGDL